MSSRADNSLATLQGTNAVPFSQLLFLHEESVESTPKSQPDNPTSGSVRRKGNTPKYFVCLISKIQMFHDLRSADVLCPNLISFRV